MGGLLVATGARRTQKGTLAPWKRGREAKMPWNRASERCEQVWHIWKAATVSVTSRRVGR